VSEYDQEFEFYVGPATHLEGASLAIDGTARVDGKIVGKVSVKHLIVGIDGVVEGDISGETATIEGTVEDTLSLTGKLTVCGSGRIRGKIQYGSLQTEEGAKLVGEITTDWDRAAGEPKVSSRLEAFNSGVNMSSDKGALDA